MSYETEPLTRLEPGMPLLIGDRVLRVSDELASSFSPGDRLLVVPSEQEVLVVPADEHRIATDAVDRAQRAFLRMGAVDADAVAAFYDAFAAALADDATFDPIRVANEADVARAKERGRSTTRLELSPTMRQDMIAGLHAWRDAGSARGSVLRSHQRDGWTLDEVVDGLGVVAFVFEGRPNVFADATGVLLSGNTVVFRIGSDALGTARAIVEHALDPALDAAGLPAGAVTLVDSRSHAAGWALFSDRRLGLAVARGSGQAVALMGAIARQAGNPVSLHGTGGAWIVADETADPARLRAVVQHSLDRKVCNTLNTCCIVRSAADRLVPAFLEGLDAAAAGRGVAAKLWVAAGDEGIVPAERWTATAAIGRAEGLVDEPAVETIARDALGTEWEWEDSPEVTLVLVDDVDEAVALFNDQAPRFVASLVSSDAAAHDAFFDAVDAPFVGDGFTRWVDGQYALHAPELGLSNWEHGRLFGRSAILSGDSVFTVRMRVRQSDPDVHR